MPLGIFLLKKKNPAKLINNWWKSHLEETDSKIFLIQTSKWQLCYFIVHWLWVLLGHVQNKIQKVWSGDRPCNAVVWSLAARNLWDSEALLDQEPGFCNAILRSSRYQIPEKMFQDEGRLKRCCWLLEKDNRRQTEPYETHCGQGTETKPVWQTVHLRTLNNYY